MFGWEHMVKIVSALHKGVEFVQTVTSGVNNSLLSIRLPICESCEFVKKVDDKRYCNACSCPQWSMAELHTKLAFKGAVCPKGKFGMFDKLATLATKNEMRSFITMVVKMVDAGLIQPQEVTAGDEPIMDWTKAKPDTIGVKVLTTAFLNNANQKMSEALKSENFEAGFMAAVQLFAFFRP